MTNENPQPKETSNNIDGWISKSISFVALWTARLALAVLASAGTLHLLGGVDAIIAWPVTVVLVGLLVKETL